LLHQQLLNGCARARAGKGVEIHVGHCTQAGVGTHTDRSTGEGVKAPMDHWVEGEADLGREAPGRLLSLLRLWAAGASVIAIGEPLFNTQLTTLKNQRRAVDTILTLPRLRANHLCYPAVAARYCTRREPAGKV
jgi:hypothetical protein